MAFCMRCLSHACGCGRSVPPVKNSEEITLLSEAQSDARLRRLIDITWQTATDSQEVPSKKWADELIERWKAEE